MIRLVRYIGFLLIIAGGVVLLVWMIKPLQFIWPWLAALPWPIKVGFSAAAGGLVLLFASLLYERFEERGQDQSLRDQ